MITQLRIQNFRIFDEITIENFSRINLITGKYGKTTLLESISLYASNGLSFSEIHQHERLRSTLSVNNANNSIFTDSFIIGTSDSEFVKITPYSLHARGKRYDYEYVSSYNNISVSKLYHIWRSNTNYHESIITFLNEAIGEAIGTNTRQFNPIIDSFDFGDYQYETWVILNTGKRLPLNVVLGSGAYRIFEILLLAINAKDGILLIDNLENNLHPSFIRGLWNMLIKLSLELNIQIFATSHSFNVSYDLYYAAIYNSVTEVSLYRIGRWVTKSNFGKIGTTHYKFSELRGYLASEQPGFEPV